MPVYRESFVFYIETDEPALLWTGHGDLLLPADEVLDAPAIALGGGSIINLPDLQELINGAAQRLEISVSGVDEATLVFALEEAAQIPGAPVWIGRVTFDEDWQQGAVEWEWSGEGRGIFVTGEDGEDGRVRTITLKVASGDTTRSRAPFSFFTDSDQRRDFPTDAFFSNVGRINSGTSRRWGPGS